MNICLSFALLRKHVRNLCMLGIRDCCSCGIYFQFLGGVVSVTSRRHEDLHSNCRHGNGVPRTRVLRGREEDALCVEETQLRDALAQGVSTTVGDSVMIGRCWCCGSSGCCCWLYM